MHIKVEVLGIIIMLLFFHITMSFFLFSPLRENSYLKYQIAKQNCTNAKLNIKKYYSKHLSKRKKILVLITKINKIVFRNK